MLGIMDPSPEADNPSVGQLWRETSTSFGWFPNIVAAARHRGVPAPVHVADRPPHHRARAAVVRPRLGRRRHARREHAMRMTLFETVMAQDTANMAAIQRSVESRGARPFQIGWHERLIHHFHRAVDLAIGAERLPPRLAVSDALDGFVEGRPLTSTRIGDACPPARADRIEATPPTRPTSPTSAGNRRPGGRRDRRRRLPGQRPASRRASAAPSCATAPTPLFEPIGRYSVLDGDGMLHGGHASATDGVSVPQPVDPLAGAAGRARPRRGRSTPAWATSWTSPTATLTGDAGPVKNPANTHVIEHAGRRLALWEGGLPTEVTAGARHRRRARLRRPAPGRR